MLEVQLTEEFEGWLDGIDKPVRGRIAARLRKLQRGAWGDCKSVGGGVVELREHFGPGYRKSSQSADIVKAIELARQT
jgi:putative addiction module killer protein